MAKRTTGTILHEIVVEIGSTGGALRRLADLLQELAGSVVTGAPPDQLGQGRIVDFPSGRERDPERP